MESRPLRASGMGGTGQGHDGDTSSDTTLDGPLAEAHALVEDRLDADAFLDEVRNVRRAFFDLLDDRAAALYVCAREGGLDPDDQDRFLPGTEVTFQADVRSVRGPRTFTRSGGRTGCVLDAELWVEEEDRAVRFVLWDDDAEAHADLAPDDRVRLEQAWVRDGRFGPEVHLGRHGTLERLGATAGDADGAAAAQAGGPPGPPAGDTDGDGDDGEGTVDLAGVLRALEPTRTYERDDGATGFVTTIEVEPARPDGQGGPRGQTAVTLWNEAVRAVQGIRPGDRVELFGLVRRDGTLHAVDPGGVKAPDGRSPPLDAFDG